MRQHFSEQNAYGAQNESHLESGPKVEIISSGDYPNEEQFMNLNIKNSKPPSEMNFELTDNLVQTDTDEVR